MKTNTQQQHLNAFLINVIIIVKCWYLTVWSRVLIVFLQDRQYVFHKHVFFISHTETLNTRTNEKYKMMINVQTNNKYIHVLYNYCMV